MRFLTLALAILLAALGCHRTVAEASANEALPIVTATSTDLLLTWIDERGEFHVEQSVASVPVDQRDVVRVVDPSRDPPAQDRVFVANLGSIGPEGRFPVRLVTRDEFESVAVTRRRERGAVLEPQQAARAATAASGGVDATHSPVVIYGASWCGPCHQVQAYLRQRGVPFIDKDIESDEAASREMQSKLAMAGMHGSSIPVIDVRGKILVGFDPRALDRALSN
jgi:glutaredoxin